MVFPLLASAAAAAAVVAVAVAAPGASLARWDGAPLGVALGARRSGGVRRRRRRRVGGTAPRGSDTGTPWLGSRRFNGPRPRIAQCRGPRPEPDARRRSVLSDSEETNVGRRLPRHAANWGSAARRWRRRAVGARVAGPSRRRSGGAEWGSGARCVRPAPDTRRHGGRFCPLDVTLGRGPWEASGAPRRRRGGVCVRALGGARRRHKEPPRSGRRKLGRSLDKRPSR